MAFLDSPVPLAFAHRGFAHSGDENCMAAFARAVELGYRYLETDVRATADGVPVAFHDSRLDRVTDRAGRIGALSWREVAKARIAGREPIPRLIDVLAAWPDTLLNLDIKHAAAIGPTIDAILHTGTLERVCVGAFSDARIAAIRGALGPRLCTSLGPREAIALTLPRSRPTAGLCAQVPARAGRMPVVDRRYLDRAHRLGLQVHVWTVNDRAEMQRLLDLGVDGIMTDRADLLRAVLRDRGVWVER